MPRRDPSLPLAFCLALLAWTWAGAAWAAMPRIGVEAGLNQSGLTYRSDAIGEPRLRPAWSAGITVDQPLAASLSLHTGLRYIEYGDVIEFGLYDGTGTLVLESRDHQVWRYLAVPALVRWRPLPTRGLFFEAGPEAGYLLQSELLRELSDAGAYDPNPPKRSIGSQIFEQLGTAGPRNDMTSLFHRWNLSLAGGAGYELRLLGCRASVEARYTQGLTDVAKSWALQRSTRGLEALVAIGR